MKKKKNTKKVSQVQALRRVLDVGELDQVYGGGGGVLYSEGTKGGDVPME